MERRVPCRRPCAGLESPEPAEVLGELWRPCLRELQFQCCKSVNYGGGIRGQGWIQILSVRLPPPGDTTSTSTSPQKPSSNPTDLRASPARRSLPVLSKRLSWVPGAAFATATDRDTGS